MGRRDDFEMTEKREWYAVRTKPRQEARARVEFERQGLEVYLPMALTRIRHARKIDWEPRPFLPGYLFLHLAPEERCWTRIRSTYGAIGVVHFGLQYPPVPDEVIAMMRASKNANGAIETSRTPLAPFADGERVRVCGGSLAGLEGIFQEMRGQDRAVVFLNWLGGQIHAQVTVEQLTAV